MPNILVATLGGTWQVIPELLGFTNRDDVPLYGQIAPRELHVGEEWPVQPVDSIWLVTTDSETAIRGSESLSRWVAACRRPFPVLVWCLAGVTDITTADESRQMADLIYRLVLHAHGRADGGQVVLSLAGGRKTMSAELQQAGRVFGCSAMLHIVDVLPADRSSPEYQEYKELQPEDWVRPLPDLLRSCFRPVVIAARVPPLDTISDADALRAKHKLSFPDGMTIQRETPRVELYDEVTRLLQDASQLYENYRNLQLEQVDSSGNFRGLYMLPAHVVRRLREERIGANAEQLSEDLKWLQDLPKAELHCHLGGILTPAEMIRVAATVEACVAEARRANTELDQRLCELEGAVRAGDEDRIGAVTGVEPGALHPIVLEGHGLSSPLTSAALLLAFRDSPELLDRWIFGPCTDPGRYRGVGYKKYARFGDFQGSGLLRSRETIRETMVVLGEYCREDHIRYLELRCSPWNYATDQGLSVDEVLEEILNGLDRIDCCDVRLILIASRHRRADRILEHVQRTMEWLDRNERFAERFVGFDVAGDEMSCRPAELRSQLAQLRHRVVRFTVHAGEGPEQHQYIENVWQAIYELSADRIGHGLSLGAHDRLVRLVRDRGIAIELCPSSNDQIIGYRNRFLSDPDSYDEYPLADYMESGLRVTINTDNRGISRTTLSNEYLRAAAMTPDGLTRWQVLQLVRNGFRAAFCDYQTRRRLLRDAETEIVKLV